MKILLTGGAGFIGSHLAEAFLNQKHMVAIVDNLSHPVKNFQKILNKTKFYKADIKDFSTLKKIFQKEKPDIINHHSAESSISASGISVFENNVLGTLNLLESAKEFKIKKFIFASSAAVYGKQQLLPIKENVSLNPFSNYGISKLTAEYYLQLYQKYFSVIIFRYGNVYGPRQDSTSEGGVVSIFSQKILNNKPCQIYGDGKQIRDFIFVEDIVKTNLKCLKLNHGGIFNISTGKQKTILELFELLKKISRQKAVYQFVKQRKGEIRKSLLDNSQAKTTLNWQAAYTLEQGLKITFNNLKNNQ